MDDTEKAVAGKDKTMHIYRSGSVQLAKLSYERRRLHGLITGTLLVFGVGSAVGGMSTDIMLEHGVFGEEHKILATYFQIAWTTGFFSMVLSIMPTYSTTTRWASVLALAYATLGFVNAAIKLVFLVDEPPSIGRTRDLVVWSAYLLTSIYLVWEPLRLVKFSFKDCRFTTPPRQALKGLWRVTRLLALCIGACSYVAVSFNVFGLHQGLFEQCDILTPNITNTSRTDLPHSCVEDLRHQAPPVCLLIVGSWQIMLAVISSPERRGRLLFLLGRLMLGDNAQSAATIASMLPNGKSPEKTIQIAKKRFRALPFSALSVYDLKSNEDTGLYEKTEPINLGAVTAFMSHSWRDKADPKFGELSKWASQYMNKHGEAPTIWLDKGCILQSSADDIKENLLCLPIYLAFCRQLLVLAGPSYSSRLWCVLELYCFVAVRPQLDGLVIRPFGDDVATTSLMTSFDEFDANKASCFLDKDRHHLLAMIEAGYGSIPAFNRKLRGIVRSIDTNTKRSAKLDQYVV